MKLNDLIEELEIDYNIQVKKKYKHQEHFFIIQFPKEYYDHKVVKIKGQTKFRLFIQGLYTGMDLVVNRL